MRKKGAAPKQPVKMLAMGRTEVEVRGGKAIRLRYCYMEVDISRVHPNTWNYNEQDDFMFQKQGESLLEFGQVEAILVRDHSSLPGHFEIINGEHRWKKMLELGAKTILVNRLQSDDGTPLDDIEARKLTIVLNEMSGNPNHTDLATLIADITRMSSDLGVEAAEALRSLPYDEVQLEHLQSMAEGLSASADSLLEDLDSAQVGDMRVDQEAATNSPQFGGGGEAFFRMSFSSRAYYKEWWSLVNALLHELGFIGSSDQETVVNKDGISVMTTVVIGDVLCAGFGKANIQQVAERVKKKLKHKYDFE